MMKEQNKILYVKKKAVSGVIWRFAERIISQSINVLVSIILANVMIPEEYGIVAIVLIVINIANSLVVNGLGTSLIQKKDSDEIDFSTMLWVGIFFAFILYGVIFFLAPSIANIFGYELLTPVLRVIAIKLPIAAVNSIQQAYVSKQLLFRKFFVATLLGTVISAVVGIGMAIKGFGVWALVGQYLTSEAINTLVLFFVVRWRPRFIFSYERMKDLLPFGWRVSLNGFIGIVCDQLKDILIGIRYTSTELSFSSQGQKIPSFLARNVETTLNAVLFPAITLFQDDLEKVKSGVRRSMKISAFIIMPMMFGIAGVSKSVISLLLPAEWLESVPYMQIAAIQHAFGILGVVNLQALKALGRSDVSLKLTFIKKPILFFILTVTMNISPMAMAIGVVIYAVIASLINLWPNTILLRYTLKEQISDIIAPFLISTIMFGVISIMEYINIGNGYILLLQVLLGLFFYVFSAWIFKIDSFKYCSKLMYEFVCNREKE